MSFRTFDMSIASFGRRRASLAVLVVLAFAPALVAQTEDAVPAPPKPTGPPPKVLFLTHSAGFVHDVVKRPEPGTLSHAEKCLIEAARGRFEVIATQDCAALALDQLPKYAGVLFYTTGELPIAPEQRDALLEWVKSGGAFIGIHSASDTFYQYPPYQRMVGGVFDGHPWHQEIRIKLEEGAHPATATLEDGFLITDEIYQFRDFTRTPVNVLMWLENSSVDLAKGARADREYALAWCRDWGEGRVFYTALGHRSEVWQDKRFLGHLLGGIDWAVNQVDWSASAPRGATVLTGATRGAEAWRRASGEPAPWLALDDGVESVPGTGHVFTHGELGDARIHLEFRVPPRAQADAKGEVPHGGVLVHGRYEVRLVDSHGIAASASECGAIEGGPPPQTAASRQPGVWQSCDIEFRAPRFDDANRRTSKARMNVWLNGIQLYGGVEGGVELAGPSPGAPDATERAFGPLGLADGGAAVAYRNIWFVPLAN